MNLFKALFGGKEETPEEKQQADEAKSFDMFKYDGVKAAKMGQMDYAIKCYKEALKIHDDLEVRDYLAQALIHEGDLLPAYEQLQKLAEAEPDNQAIFIQMASVTYMMEDYPSMAQACEKALLIDKDNARVHYLYAQACIGQDDMINAIAMLTKAITLKDDYAEAYLLRGQTLLKMGDVNGADEDATYLMTNYPDNEDILLLKARVEHAKGNGDEAIAIYNKVVDVNPFSVDAFKERGAIKYEKGDSTGAQEDAQKVQELQPQDMADVNGDYSAEGVENKVKQAYSNINPLGL